MMIQRPRRLRSSDTIRKMLAETKLSIEQFVYPVFFKAEGPTEAIKAMPGQFRWSPQDLPPFLESLYDKGLRSWALFPVIKEEFKSKDAKESFNPEGLAPQTIKLLKKKFPESVLICDVALDPYSSDGHDGLVLAGKIINDPTLEVLSKQALCLAKSGADVVAPSDMMDGRVGKIRKDLEENSLAETLVLSYCAKYASHLYGPFREALDSAPRAGDKKTYQINPRNFREARRELQLDLEEGADIVMVKPAGFYLDIIKEFKEHSSVPVAAYQVSGEYSMIQCAIENKIFSKDEIVNESLLAIKRAGADLILSYFAADIALGKIKLLS